MVFHGDEGRGRKRLPFLVLNFHSVLGRGLQVHSKKKPGWIKMAPNYHGHTLTSRFLLAALPKAAYANEHGHVWESLMDLAADEARHMFFTGVTDLISGRGTFHMAMLHICGDWPWLADSGGFKRSYRNVQKHKTRTKPPVGICHMRAAGQIGYDFEQLNTDQPAWIATMFTQELFCEGFDPSPFVRIPHVPGQTGALWYFDVFHTMHLGVCKYLLGSCLALMSEVEPGSSIDARFDSLSCRFIRWCKESKRRPHIAGAHWLAGANDLSKRYMAQGRTVQCIDGFRGACLRSQQRLLAADVAVSRASCCQLQCIFTNTVCWRCLVECGAS